MYKSFEDSEQLPKLERGPNSFFEIERDLIMANPQTENGYAKVTNELLEALSRINLSSYETRVLFCVIRKTYGWNKKDDYISVSQIAKGTRLLKPHACRAKIALVRKNILNENGGKLGPNKDYDKWSVTDSGNESLIKRQKQRIVTNIGTVPKSVTSVTDSGNESLPIQALQKKVKTLIQKKVKTSLYKGENLKPPKTKKENIPPVVQQVFDNWNKFAGQSVQKRNSQGKILVTVRWKAHRLLTKDKRQAIMAALKDYAIEEICGAIDNFAKILLGREYFWTYPWALHEFLTRGVERHKGAARQWWAFIPDNFDAERYRVSGGGNDVLFSDPSIEEAEAIRNKIFARSKT